MRSIGKRQKVPMGDRTYIDYKDVEFLQRLLTPQGKILPRKRIGCDAKMQHRLKTAIHRARYMALLEYGV